MASRRRIPAQIKEQVRERAKGLCEYCHTIERWQYVTFTVDHIIPLSQGGTGELKNLALACFHCNRHKSDFLLGGDPITGEVYRLFNPRQHSWSEHFIWSANGTEIRGLTPIGHVTIAQLQLNRPRILNIRRADVAIGRHPPADDPRLNE
jgi:hypothetical protein